MWTVGLSWRITRYKKLSTYSPTLFHCRFLVDITRFSPCVIHLWCNMNKLSRKIERRSTLSNKFWLCCSFFIKLTTCHASTSSKSTNQRAAFLCFFNPQQMFFMRDKLITQVEKRETSTQNLRCLTVEMTLRFQILPL